MKRSVAAVLALLVSVATAAPSASSTAAGAFSTQQSCKAAVSVIMGRSPSIMKASTAGDEVKISYVRSDDGSTWKFKCRLEGSRVMWGSDPGRWRTHPDDERVYYSVSGTGASARLTIEEKYGDGSATKKSFTWEQLQQRNSAHYLPAAQRR
jgi:hypothetical protein